MKEFLLFGVLPALVFASVLFVVLERFVRRIPARWPRRSVRVVCVLGDLLLALVALPVFVRPLDEGTWFCPVCGAIEERRSYLGITLETYASPADEEVACARRYSEWLARTGAVPHAHGWIPIGCHWGYGTVSCTMIRVNDLLFYTSLPLAPDATLARGLVLRLTRASGAESRELLRDFQRGEDDGLFRRLERGSPLTREEFTTQFAAWLDAHPSWR